MKKLLNDEELRDEMAKAAMTGILSSEPADYKYQGHDFEHVAEMSYRAADAMMELRALLEPLDLE